MACAVKKEKETVSSEEIFPLIFSHDFSLPPKDDMNYISRILYR